MCDSELEPCSGTTDNRIEAGQSAPVRFEAYLFTISHSPVFGTIKAIPIKHVNTPRVWATPPALGSYIWSLPDLGCPALVTTQVI